MIDFVETGDIEDLGQAALGLILITPGLNGGIVIAGSIALLAWEIAEMVHDHQQEVRVPNLN